MVAQPATLEPIAEPERAEHLLDPTRNRIMHLARDPIAPNDLAKALGQTRQRINYHVKQLHEAGLLRIVDETRRGRAIERTYQATAQAYLVAPQALGPLAAGDTLSGDRLSAAHLLAVTARTQTEVTRALHEAQAEDERVATLSLTSAFRFTSAAQREAFTHALTKAITEVVEAHTSPLEHATGATPSGRPYRLTLTAHPIPPGPEDPATTPPATEVGA